jgi:glyoxylase-like metal-dependent hydrolase (beta-lactamase superfamily II)
MRKGNQAFRNVRVLLPHFTFNEGEINIRVGKKSLAIITLPGHSADNIGVIVEEDRVMFSGDTAMPLPYIVDGDLEQMISSLKRIATLGLENIVQGHGDIILRGEIEMYVRDNLNYLSNIRRAVRKSARRKYSQEVLDEFDIETCGKSHVLIGGLAEELHRRNLRALYRQFYGELPASSPVDEFD